MGCELVHPSKLQKKRIVATQRPHAHLHYCPLTLFSDSQVSWRGIRTSATTRSWTTSPTRSPWTGAASPARTPPGTSSRYLTTTTSPTATTTPRSRAEPAGGRHTHLPGLKQSPGHAGVKAAIDFEKYTDELATWATQVRVQLSYPLTQNPPRRRQDWDRILVYGRTRRRGRLVTLRILASSDCYYMRSSIDELSNLIISFCKYRKKFQESMTSPNVLFKC